MDEQLLMRQSTERLEKLLANAVREDLALLAEYNFGKDAGDKTAAELVAQIRYNGSNDLVRLVRGDGVDYLTIVRDVADKMDIKWSADEAEESLEIKLYAKVFEQAWQRMSEEEREPIKRLFQEQGLDTPYISKLLVEGTFTEFMPTISYLVAWNVARIVAVAVARQAGAEAAAGAFAEGLGGLLFGPAGVLLGIIVVLTDLAGPAYRKTIPTVLQVAYMRQKAKVDSAPSR